MARYIHCESCNKRIAELAKKHGELYESIEGTAKFEMFCDGAHADEFPIKPGDKCFAAVLLTNRNHVNYESQKPAAWAKEILNIPS